LGGFDTIYVTPTLFHTDPFTYKTTVINDPEFSDVLNLMEELFQWLVNKTG